MKTLFSRWGEGGLGMPSDLPAIMVEASATPFCLAVPLALPPFTLKAVIPQCTDSSWGKGKEVIGPFSSLA